MKGKHNMSFSGIRRCAIACAMRGASVACFTVVAALPALAAEPASASDTRRYDVPAGPLAEALTLFAAQAGVALSFDPTPLAARRSAGLAGTFTVSEGFERLLAGSGYRHVPAGPGEYALQPIPEDALLLPAVHVEGSVASAGSGDAYTTTAIGAGGKTPQTLREIPQSVTVVTQQRIADQNLENVAEVLEQVTGVTAETGFFGLGQGRFYARGFQLKNTQIDGAAAATAINSEVYDPICSPSSRWKSCAAPTGCSPATASRAAW